MKWSEIQEPNEQCRYHHVYYDCPVLGRITIEWKGHKETKVYDCTVFNNCELIINVYENTLGAAKAAVFKKYLELINSALAKLIFGNNQ